MKQPIPFGKYFLLERINVGGMAEVFKAKATGVEGFERLVAVKRILPSIAEDEEFITMFVDEAKIAVQLTHANIAQIFDLGRVEGSFFIALEYVHGKDLRAMFNRMRQRGELLPIPMSCYAIMKLCEGLDYAHNKRDSGGDLLNLVHRDVSPQNILISYEGEVKIIDFGIAKAAGKVGRTQAGILKGKFGYMSPEQVQGFEIDRRSDVFGVGICLYELLTGERLFIAESDFATLEKVRSVDVMPPSTYNRRIPEELEQIVMRSLARDREQRYQSALQLHDELQSFMHTSGNVFSRKDLSVFMHRVFGEEIEKESARDQEYAQIGTPHFNAEPSGLEVFDELEPVSTVSALVQQGQGLPPMAPGQPAGRGQRKATLLGIPHLNVARPPAPSTVPGVPRLLPRLQSMPPSAANGGAAALPSLSERSSISGRSGRDVAPMPASLLDSTPQPALSPNGNGQHPAQGLGMEWDDEELSTQIYDKPDERALAFMFGRSSGTSPGALPSAPPGSLPSAPPATLVAEPARAPIFHPARASDPLPARAAYADATAQWESRTRTSPILVACLVVVGIVASIVAGLLLFGRPDPANVQFASVPAKASVMVDGQPIPGSSSPFVLAQLTPNTPHTIVVSSPGYRPWTSRVELSAGQNMQLPTVTLERIESGFAIDSQPAGARVLVDGELRGATPLRLTDLRPGEHRVRLELEGHAAWDSVLLVTEGTVLPLQAATLQPLPAEPPELQPRSRVASESAARRRAAIEPATDQAAQAEPPAHGRASAHEPRPAEDGEPAPAAESAAEVSDVSSPGTLRINSRPWSRVFVDGKLIGVTPQRNLQLPAGTHTVLLVNEEFDLQKTVTVEIKPGEVTTQVHNLSE